ncbi:UvrB/uvrC motif protein [Pseudobythopirellula maris]|uniref:UvrB/uvrC motif protein n=1 Tax=Pseudobythopirellula maris TaxID=2527991 RepID=A0A5C5ZS75_9BACT|nr:UvrB/UvrC motif-containing protein [Pseudobythopirellula maris]TWT89945.1 UvrB/uvrC motif protein [Pseudobythopirellula maris]
MSPDIRPILNDWPFEPNDVTVRIVTAGDGVELLQMRLDLGLLQMELSGRPDGARIQNHESLLDLHRTLQKRQEEEGPEDAPPYLLEPEDCAALMREGAQYYHRYVGFWKLGRYELCARDTERNLRLFDFVREHARHDRDKMQFDQWLPYVAMMHARAVATPLASMKQFTAAIGAIDAGIRRIEQFLAEYNREAQADQVNELLFLKRWRREIAALAEEDAPAAQLALARIEQEIEEPEDPIQTLKRELDEAIAAERYEDAAGLRDEIQRLEDPPPPGAGLG